ncbi:hypothetical protein ALC60_08086 [Trachymyrmex zeteki]|uniref:Uncharacterized protein n=1 Tax=Mycetomoellerius zeteki TaxID=64791 RepID=A0A151WYF8_9HYME|nr:hypothetical protein ALC60_08086 [Trachymyrmex zeteki]
MKITYAVMPTDGPVQSIDSGGVSTARRAVKITLKNLKRWCERLRHRKVARDFKNNRHNQLRGIKIPYHGNIMMTMIVDQEESRNRANENLENELRESLAINDQSKLHCAYFDDDDCQLESTTLQRTMNHLSEICPEWRSSQEFFEDLKVVLEALKIA